MKKKKKVFLFATLAIVLLFVVNYVTCYFINKYYDSKEIDSEHYIPITYLIMDEKNTPEKLDSVSATTTYSSSIFYTTQGFVDLKKDGDYYVGTYDNTNSILRENIAGYGFAINDTSGTVLNDALFEDNKTIKIPTSYYENYKKGSKEPVKLELIVRTSEEKIKNTKIKINFLNSLKKNKTVTVNSYNNSTSFSIMKYKKGKNLTKSDISLYVNGSNVKVNENYYAFDTTSGTIKLNISPILIDKIGVRIRKRSLIERILNIKPSEAVSYDDMTSSAKLKEEPNLKEGDTMKVSLKTWYFWPSCDNNGCNYMDEVKNAQANAPQYLYNKDTNELVDPETDTGYGNEWYDFVARFEATNYKCDSNGDCIDQGTEKDYGNNFKFEETVYLAFYCVQHVVSGGDKTAYREYNMTVIAKGDDYIVVQFIGIDDGTWQGKQIGGGRLKFTWDKNEPEEGSIKAQKILYDQDNNQIKNKKFMLSLEYMGDDADTLAKNPQIRTVRASYSVTWNNLPFGRYQIKEIDCNKNLYVCDEYIRIVELNKEDCTGKLDKNGVCSTNKYVDVTATTADKDNPSPFINYIQNWCLKVKKVDAESNCSVQGLAFDLYTGSSSDKLTKVSKNSAITDSSGYATFENLKYRDDYYIKETSKNGTSGTETCSGKKSHLYFNSSPSTIKIKAPDVVDDDKKDLIKMDYVIKNNKISFTCPNNATSKAKAVVKKDNRYHYCVVVKKVDANTGAALEGAVFNATNAIGFQYIQYNSAGAASSTLGDGLAYFYLGESTSSTITESQAPTSYALSTEKINATAVALPEESATAGIEFVTACQQAYKDAGIEEAKYTMKDQKLLINWYKENENGKAVSGAKFNARYTDENNSYKYIKVKMSDSGNRVKVDYPEKSPQKKCYVFDSFATETQKNNLQSTEQNPVDLVSDDNGEVCIIGVPNNGKKVGDNTQAQGAYTIVETKPAKYHTFSNKKTIQLNLTTSIQAKTSNNTFTNYETEFEFTKDVSSGDSNTEIIINGVKKTLKELTTEELQKIVFNIYNSNGDILHFVKNSDGTYDFAGNDKDAPSNLTSASSALYLNQNRKLKVLHLPKGTYSIKESQGNTCSNSTDSSKCVGYYYPNYSSNSSHQFTITDCSSSKATSCTTYGVVTQKLINTPTEITFTKKDFYSYYDAADKNKSEENVKFENDKERNDFDKIVFKIKDSSGRYLTLKKVADHGNCSTDDSYSEYRYVSSDQTDKNGTELHTCGGHIKITNLCRGNEYTVEEVSVPDGSVYVKENTTSTPTSAKYQIPCTEGDTTHKTTTNIINDKPTRVRFEKRDSKYNYLIDDETTTFEVYKCKKGTECHPADYKTVAEREKNGMTLVKFSPRAVITKDEEDPTDAAGLAGVEVYKKISDSDVSKGQKYVTSLHPYKGLLILRYLESNDSNSSYVLLETVAPYNYSLPSGRNAETRFTVTNTTVKVDEIDVPNKPTSLIIRKYSDDGKLLPGAEFKVYEGTSCDANLSAMNQPKKLLKLKTIRDGVYENRPEQDTDTVLTCTDKDGAKCSDIAVNNMTSLTYKNYQNTWADFNESLTNDNKKVQIKEGEALIQYLEYDHCYIIEETKAPKGYSLPKNDEDRFTMVTIPKNTEYVSDTYKTLINKPTPFTFYKYDEYNNLLDGAEFKLQKLDSNKKYHDITVTKEETETGVFYKVDKSTDNKVITTKDGKATVYYLEEGQYRIVETKAAPGKELGKNPNVATFFVDSAGNVYGNSIIVNKAKTETLSFTSSASAEFLIWNRTGQTVIRYGLIISSIVAVIVALMIALRIKKKSE